MEVCQQRVHDFEIAGGVEEEARSAGAGGDGWMDGRIDGLGRGGNGFEGAECSRADGDDAAAFLFCRVDGAGRFLADVEALRVHGMCGERFSFDRRESAKADMEG